MHYRILMVEPYRLLMSYLGFIGLPRPAVTIEHATRDLDIRRFVYLAMAQNN